MSRSMGGLTVTVDGRLPDCLAWQPDVAAVIGGVSAESRSG
ncbi:hypothetical protein [Paludibacterium paludis]|nr:hypothetical protein [Paludibacterium paludis]